MIVVAVLRPSFPNFINLVPSFVFESSYMTPAVGSNRSFTGR